MESDEEQVKRLMKELNDLEKKKKEEITTDVKNHPMFKEAMDFWNSPQGKEAIRKSRNREIEDV